MSVFYVHDITKRIVTPLDRRYYVREIPHTTETEEITPISAQNKNPAPEQQRRQQALETYRETSSQLAKQAGRPEALISLGKVGDIMTPDPVSASLSESIAVAWQLMSRHGIHHLPIMDEQQFLCGFVSESDLLTQVIDHANAPADNIRLEIFCKDNVVSAGIETEVRMLGDYLLKSGVDGLPVTENGVLMGVVTASDILKQLLAHANLDSHA